MPRARDDEVDDGGRVGAKRRGPGCSQADIISKDAEPLRKKDRWKYRVEGDRTNDGQRPIKLIPTGGGDEGDMNGADVYIHTHCDMLTLWQP